MSFKLHSFITAIEDDGIFLVYLFKLPFFWNTLLFLHLNVYQGGSNMEGSINSITHPHLDVAFLTIKLRYCIREENKTPCSPFYLLCSSGLKITNCGYL